MSALRIFMTFITFLVITSSSYCQSDYNLPPKESYKEAIIGLKNFKKFQVHNLMIKDDSISYSKNGMDKSMHLEEINYIRVHEGNKAKGGALIGGISMLLISISSIIQVESDPNYELKENVVGLVGVYTAGGAVLGGLIGSVIKKKTSYYIHASRNQSTD